MEKLFGLSMNTIAGCLGTVLLLVLAVLALVAWRRPVMFKLGLRPIPRRRAQSTLIVFGLMLASLIITAAFGTGDTLSFTIRSLVIDEMGEIDEIISTDEQSGYFKIDRYDELSQQLTGYADIDVFMPVIRANTPVVNTTRSQSLRNLDVMALRPEDAGTILTEDITDSQGRLLELVALEAHEVYLNAPAAEALHAQPGDVLELYTGPRPKIFTVRAIAAQGENPRLLLTLRQAQGLFDQRGNINGILVSNRGDAIAGADLSPSVTTHLRELLADPKVASQIFVMLTGDSTIAETMRAAADQYEGNTQADLLALANGLDGGQLTPEVQSLLADESTAGLVVTTLNNAHWRNQATRDRLEDLFGDLANMTVQDVKRDNLDTAELAASAFTTIFIVTGLFGIGAGLVLIFLIFVMLAAERKSEMGMARAVGAQRGHLVEMFVFEGTAYDIAAAGVGVALGVATGLFISVTLGQMFAAQSDLQIRPHVTLRSLAVSYSLGMLVTFATVLFSAYRVSRLNIVSAIRDLPEPPPPPRHLQDRFLAPLRRLVEGFKQLIRWRILPALWTWFVGIPLALLSLIWTGFTTGPLTFLLGLLLTPLGIQTKNAAAYTSGVSFVIIGGGLTLRGLLSWLFRKRPGLGDRLAFSVMGGLLLLYWTIPTDALEKALGVDDLGGGAEMLFISGVMLVAGAILVVMYNADLLLRLILVLLGGSSRLAPVLRMAIAYPLASRFRTGMTIGMFAIVIFSVIFMAALFKTNELYFADTEGLTGGYELRAETSTNNPLPDLANAIVRSPRLHRANYAVVASQSTLSVELQQDGGQWEGYYLKGVDDAYLENAIFDMTVKAEGYESAQEIWQALLEHPGYAVIDRYAIPQRSSTTFMIGGPEFKMKGFYLEDEVMQPTILRVKDPATEATFEVTVIGVAENIGYGLVTSQVTLQQSLPFEVTPTTHFIRLAEGVSPEAAGEALETVFLRYGLQSVDQVEEIRDSQASELVVERLLLGFLTLGLVVGVAALGVISTRAVVERRQQIGMLRALGFQREMVSWSFLIESSFVALLGIGIGTGLALITAYNMINQMAKDVPGMYFDMPWSTILVVVGLAYGMALLTTWLPAIQASRVTPAEALRYE